MPIVSIIAAMDRNRLIGNNNALPWHLPADLQHFKQTTLGKPIIMGRKTWESLGRALPGRMNIIITRNKDYQAEGGVVVYSLDEAIKVAGNVDEVMIIGGANLYQQAIADADRLYLTQVDGEFEGDAWFPMIDKNCWREVSRVAHNTDEKNRHAYDFVQLNRVC
ncbi:MAG: type 3 dihydrofolate reductase [Gammaproteobacteria bacterium]|nr:MAG: type 3 dihydrofolate reductase [Gammaproteobacteria bacterium]